MLVLLVSALLATAASAVPTAGPSHAMEGTLPADAPQEMEFLEPEPEDGALVADEEAPLGPAPLPTYLSLRPTLNAFSAFSEGGWDGNWYVGYNSCWIVRLPPVPAGLAFERAYIGAKVGRAKTRPKPGQTFEQEIIPARLYMAIASTPAFPSDQSFFLADTRDLPTDPHPDLISGWVGQSGWVWTEVPVHLVKRGGPNYLALWSDTDLLVSASSAPIIAAAVTDESGNAWLNRSVRGSPPREPGSALETPLNRLVPGLALKLVPANREAVEVGPLKLTSGPAGVTADFAVSGTNIETVWMEITYDRLSWERYGPLLRVPPYSYAFPADLLHGRPVYARGAALDVYGNVGYGPSDALGAKP
jgi:hypothetical protein